MLPNSQRAHSLGELDLRPKNSHCRYKNGVPRTRLGRLHLLDKNEFLKRDPFISAVPFPFLSSYIWTFASRSKKKIVHLQTDLGSNVIKSTRLISITCGLYEVYEVCVSAFPNRVSCGESPLEVLWKHGERRGAPNCTEVDERREKKYELRRILSFLLRFCSSLVRNLTSLSGRVAGEDFLGQNQWNSSQGLRKFQKQ